MIVGIDEAGRGPLAGPVVACALHLPTQPPFTPADSKIVSERARQNMFAWLAAYAHFFVSQSSAHEIDQINILQATVLAMNRAVRGLIKKHPRLIKAHFIIDGNYFVPQQKITYTCIEKADATIPEVSCASIMAKVTRDFCMNTIDTMYPGWGFSRHKGYPTKEHRQKIQQMPRTPLHRKSFLKNVSVLSI